MSGMLTQNSWSPLLSKGLQNSAVTIFTRSTGLVDRRETVYLQGRRSVTSFRSGAGFRNALNEGALVQPESLSPGGRLLGDTGHDFDSLKGSILIDSPNVHLEFPGSRAVYTGPYIPAPRIGPEASAASGELRGWAPKPLPFGSITTLGSNFVSRASPLSSQSDVLQAVIEILREGLPSSVLKSISDPASIGKRDRIKAVGSDYLNLMFGVTPLLKEIDTLMRLTSKISDLTEQLIKDSGNQIVRKRANPPLEVIYPTLTTVNGSGDFLKPLTRLPLGGDDGYSVTNSAEYFLKGGVRMESTTRDTTNSWFSGSFVYYVEKLRIPSQVRDFFDTIGNREQVPIEKVVSNYLLGMSDANISNGLWWELTPFSWLIDWFVNVGDVLDNRHAFDNLGLVMNYGYVMVEQVRSTTTTHRASDGRVFSSQVRYVRKTRRRANPYGFGLKDSDLNPFQVSILGALATNGLGSRK